MSVRSIRKNISKKENMEDKINRIREHAFKSGHEAGFKLGLKTMGEIIFYMTAYTIDYKLELSEEKLRTIMFHIYDNIDAFRTEHLTTDDFIEIKKEMEEKGIKYEQS